MSDVYGKALLDYLHGNYSEDITTHSSLGDEDEMPLPYLFRNQNQMPGLEKKALKQCKGKVLDIGCGAGSHSLYLQKKGFEVTALDRSPGAIAVCRERGIQQTVQSDFLSYTEGNYDTLLMLMNGIGIAGTLPQLGPLLQHAKTLLAPGGQLLMDSSDIIYMFEMDDDGGRWIPDTGRYYGEVEYTMTYKGEQSEPFPWLFVDYNTLQRAAEFHGWKCELMAEGPHFDYLARLWCPEQ